MARILEFVAAAEDRTATFRDILPVAFPPGEANRGSGDAAQLVRVLVEISTRYDLNAWSKWRYHGSENECFVTLREGVMWTQRPRVGAHSFLRYAPKVSEN